MSMVKVEQPQLIEIKSERSPEREIPVLSGSVYVRWIESERVMRNLLCIALNELSIPLAIIRRCADALQYGYMEQLNDPQKMKVGVIVDRTEKLTRVIEAADWGFSILEDVNGDFVSTLSRELRGPLGVIKGYAEALQYGDLGDVTDLQVMKAGVINDCADLMAEIIGRLINVERLSDGLLQEGIWPSPSREELDRMMYEVARV